MEKELKGRKKESLYPQNCIKNKINYKSSYKIIIHYKQIKIILF